MHFPCIHPVPDFIFLLLLILIATSHGLRLWDNGCENVFNPSQIWVVVTVACAAVIALYFRICWIIINWVIQNNRQARTAGAICLWCFATYYSHILELYFPHHQIPSTPCCMLVIQSNLFWYLNQAHPDSQCLGIPNCFPFLPSHCEISFPGTMALSGTRVPLRLSLVVWFGANNFTSLGSTSFFSEIQCLD